MDRTTRQLLELLSAAMETNKGNLETIQNEDWTRLYHQARLHNVVPMVYESAQKLQIIASAQPELSRAWRTLALAGSLSQMYRTMEFLRVYRKLNEAGIMALAVKGIVCRVLYPNEYYRSSSDEDIYVRRDNLPEVDSILRSEGFSRDEKRTGDEWETDVVTYRSPRHGLVIEVHLEFFSEGSRLFESMNELFISSFDDSLTITAEGVKVHTLSHDKHLLYLILHSINHFLGSGFGIRQVCDIVMYINACGSEINWIWLWEKLRGLEYDIFAMNLLDIGIKYLGMNKGKVQWPENMLPEDIHSEALLEDILEAGIFGKSTEERINTSTITLNAATDYKKHHKGRLSILRSVFPSADMLGSEYSYIKKHPILLPVAWFHRITGYLQKGKGLRSLRSRAERTVASGRKRVELLKEYKIIR